MSEPVARFIRYEFAGDVHFGRLDGESVHRLDRDFLRGGQPDGHTSKLDQLRLLAPVTPGKIIAVGLNYASHLGGRDAPAEPGLFPILPSAVVGPEDAIVIPEGASEVHAEGELVLVIGRRASRISSAEARSHVFGVTVGNDVSERRWQADDLQWLRAKGSDTFAPIGPCVATGLDYEDLLLQTRIGDELVQAQRTSDLLFGVPEILEYVTRYVTLDPGDLIFTGTPGRTRRMNPGETVEVELEGIGILRNPVRRG